MFAIIRVIGPTGAAAVLSSLLFSTATAYSPAELILERRETLETNVPSGDVSAESIPPGTILPVRLQTTISVEKSKPGQIIVGKIAQEVPLQNGSKIHAGSRVEGHILEISLSGSASGPKVSLQFDKVYSQSRVIPITTNLRAIAGFMEVAEAALPEDAASEGSPSNWWTTIQIGGDSVYGEGGPVMSSDNSSEVVGKSVNGGVLSRVSAKEGTKCRGTLADNISPQALWVFSSNACGAYGMGHIKIVHAGRTNPVGTITLASDSSKLKIPAATAMLLRVNPAVRE
jgi:hypothetical protein